MGGTSATAVGGRCNLVSSAMCSVGDAKRTKDEVMVRAKADFASSTRTSSLLGMAPRKNDSVSRKKGEKDSLWVSRAIP